MVNIAKPLDGITINTSYQLEGVYWLETDCADYDAWKALPAVVAYDNRAYGKTGWNSDSGKACYSTNKLFAQY